VSDGEYGSFRSRNVERSPDARVCFRKGRRPPNGPTATDIVPRYAVAEVRVFRRSRNNRNGCQTATIKCNRIHVQAYNTAKQRATAITINSRRTEQRFSPVQFTTNARAEKTREISCVYYAPSSDVISILSATTVVDLPTAVL